MNTTITAIINFNNIEDTAECVQSCLDSKIIPQDVVIIDNGSIKESMEQLKKLFPAIHMVSLVENIGYAGAVNEAFKYSTDRGYRYTFILNNDVVVNSKTIVELEKTLLKSSSYAIAAPVNYVQGSNFKRICFSGGIVDYKRAITEHFMDPIEEDRESDFITGASFMVENELFFKLGGYDESYFMYYEDSDFGERLKRAGYKMVVSASSFIEHKVSSTSNRFLSVMYYGNRNRIIFFLKYSPKRYVLSFIWVYLLEYFRKVAKLIIFPTKRNAFIVYYLTKSFCDGLLMRAEKRVEIK